MLLLGHIGITVGIVYAIERGFARDTWPKLDYRLVIIGAILPDLIDKPLSLTGLIGGRAIAHTLLFAIIISAIVSIVVLKSRKSNLLYFIPLGIAFHLILDNMWGAPDILLWPAYGFSFPISEVSVETLLQMLLSNPYLYGGEITGAIILAIPILKNKLYTGKAINQFFRKGVLS